MLLSCDAGSDDGCSAAGRLLLATGVSPRLLQGMVAEWQWCAPVLNVKHNSNVDNMVMPHSETATVEERLEPAIRVNPNCNNQIKHVSLYRIITDFNTAAVRPNIHNCTAL